MAGRLVTYPCQREGIKGGVERSSPLQELRERQSKVRADNISVGDKKQMDGEMTLSARPPVETVKRYTPANALPGIQSAAEKFPLGTRLRDPKTLGGVSCPPSLHPRCSEPQGEVGTSN